MSDEWISDIIEALPDKVDRTALQTFLLVVLAAYNGVGNSDNVMTLAIMMSVESERSQDHGGIEGLEVTITKALTFVRIKYADGHIKEQTIASRFMN